MDRIIPQDPNQPYDMLEIIGRVVDFGDFMEVHHMWARNIVVGFARLQGHPVGIVAQQPQHLAGVLDIDASTKAARFVRFCDAFNIPVVTFVDVPGFMPGSAQEYGGIIRHGAKLIYAYAEATVPKVSVLLRKAYGGAFIVMSSKMLRSDINYAWPTGEVAVMGAEGAVNVIHRSEIRSADDPEDVRAQRIEEYREQLMNPYVAASRGLIDDVIRPSETRLKLIHALEMLANKREVLPPQETREHPSLSAAGPSRAARRRAAISAAISLYLHMAASESVASSPPATPSALSPPITAPPSVIDRGLGAWRCAPWARAHGAMATHTAGRLGTWRSTPWTRTRGQRHERNTWRAR